MLYIQFRRLCLVTVIIILQFEKTGKYAERYERWLDMRVKPDGQFKKDEFKNIAETIVSVRIHLCYYHSVHYVCNYEYITFSLIVTGGHYSTRDTRKF